MFNAPVIMGRVHTYPDIFENGLFPPPFSKKKIRVHTLRVRIVFARPHENAKMVEIPRASPQNMRNASRVWCMTSSYSKTSNSVRPSTRRREASVFEKMRFRWPFSRKRKNNSPRHHTFLYISSSLHDYVVKMPNFIFCGGREQATATFSSSFLTWLWFSGIPLQQSSSTFDKVGDRDEDWKKTNALFKRYVSTAVAVVVVGF